MTEPLPSDGYGPAAWEDYNNNWRKADTDWLQVRAILRYASGPPTSGEVGQSVYDFAADRMNMRSKVNRWIPVVAAENLLVSPITSSSPTEGVGLTHKTSSGQGLVFAPNEIVVYQKLRTGASEVVIDSTGIAVQTTGGVASKLTTDASGFHSNVPVVAPTFIGDFSALATTNAKALTATSGSFSGNVSITGTLGVTGLLSTAAIDLSADPSSANRAARRSWVEGLVNARLTQAQADVLYLSQAEGDSRYLNNTGDIIASGALAFGSRLGQLINLYSTTFGIGIQSNNLYFRSASSFKFYIGGTHSDTPSAAVLSVDSTSIASSTTNLALSATNVGVTSGAGGIVFNSGGSNGIVFQTSGTERGRAYASFMWGKTATGTANVGVELFEGGAIYSTTVSGGTPNMLLRHNTDADNQAYVQFADSGGGIISAITQDDVTPVGTKFLNCTATAPSDYRWKDDLGPITDALDRVMDLKPRHLAWKSSGAEFEGFIAHEAQPVVPYLVVGEKDAVTDTGEIEGQGINYGGLTTLLTAAVQELAARIETLEGAV